jgi:hypothetical protein
MNEQYSIQACRLIPPGLTPGRAGVSARGYGPLAKRQASGVARPKLYPLHQRYPGRGCRFEPNVARSRRRGGEHEASEKKCPPGSFHLGAHAVGATAAKVASRGDRM